MDIELNKTKKIKKMSFIIYDLAFLVVFCLAIGFFLYKRKKNVTRQGLIFLYKTKLGIKLMDSFANKSKKLLAPARYLILISGYVLMISIIWVIVEASYIYLRFPVTEITKAPPIAPLIPYFPQLFGLSSFFPPFYFTYFIIAVAIGGLIHEFSHGILARFAKLRVRSTGFLFLGPFLGAFVEPDEKRMKKINRLSQLSILGAGTFSNLLVAIFTAGILWIFFLFNFSAAGVGFFDYPSAVLNFQDVKIPENFSLNESLIEIESGGNKYLANPLLLHGAIEKKSEKLRAYEDGPAVRANLKGAIMEINGRKITNSGELSSAIQSYKPGDSAKIKTAVKNGFFDTKPEFKEYNVIFGEKNGRAYLGISVGQQRGLSFSSFLFGIYFSYAGTLDLSLYYNSYLGEFGWFIYFLLWWIFLINILLAQFNMLPLGPLDGGRFLQVSVEGATKSEKIGNRVFKAFTWVLLLLIAAMMVKWVFSFF